MTILSYLSQPGSRLMRSRYHDGKTPDTYWLVGAKEAPRATQEQLAEFHRNHLEDLRTSMKVGARTHTTDGMVLMLGGA